MHFAHSPQNSMEVKAAAVVDRTVLGSEPMSRFQFERIGYFCVDFNSKPDKVRHNIFAFALYLTSIPISMYTIYLIARNEYVSFNCASIPMVALL